MTLSQIASGRLSLSSLSLTATFIPSLNVAKLSCSFYLPTAEPDIRSLQRALARLPPIPELNITTYSAAELNNHRPNYSEVNLVSAFSDLLFTLDPYNHFLFLSQWGVTILNHRHMVHSKSAY